MNRKMNEKHVINVCKLMLSLFTTDVIDNNDHYCCEF